MKNEIETLCEELELEPCEGESIEMTDSEMLSCCDKMNILACMSDVVESSCSRGIGPNKFNPAVYVDCKEQIDYICKMVGITPVQVVLLSAIIENKSCRVYTKHNLADDLGMSYIKLLSYDSDFKALAEKRLITLCNDDRISIGKNTITALAANKPYAIHEMKGLDTQAILKEMSGIIELRDRGEYDLSNMVDDIDSLFIGNPQAGIVKAAKEIGFNISDMEQADRVIFYVLVKRYIVDDDDRVCWMDFDDIIDEPSAMGYYRNRIGNNNNSPLMCKGIVEPCNEDGMASMDTFHLKDDAKAKLFAEVGGVRSNSRGASLKVTPASSIIEHKLFFNPIESEQIRRLTNLLQQDNYKATCERLRSSGMRTGFSCIFHGSPGTGKTESVYQLARATGRGIIAVNVAEIKSCWVGESEKLVKGLFDKYNAIVRESEVAPILLFNEADAIFGVRMEGAQHAVDKMENSLQNIILQEMEKLDGILIATTNLTANLDKAFERRFLYKVKFEKPGIEPKTKIWKSMIPELSETEARELAEGYDFSGGQIENISRKKVIKTILDGNEPDFAEIKSYCGEELLDGKTKSRKRIGY